MEIVRGLENVTRCAGASVTVGSFDGLHLGHQRILRMMRHSGCRPVTVVTFEPHPQEVLKSAAPPPLLTTFDERAQMFAELGVDRLVVVKFDRTFAALSAEDFVGEILLGKVGMSLIFVGPKHGFGAGRRGNPELLEQLSMRWRFRVVVVPPVVRDGDFVSSSRIRKLLLAGNVHDAMRYLGRPFTVTGVVVAGDGRGTTLGFPTANLEIADAKRLRVPAGIYATVAELNGRRYPSVSHFGPRPTFPEAKPAVESHIVGVNQSLYGANLRLGLVDRLRDVEAFASPRDLVEQMLRDREQAQERLRRLGFGPQARLRSKRLSAI